MVVTAQGKFITSGAKIYLKSKSLTSSSTNQHMIQHTINWYNGEIFEAKFILGFGVTILVSDLFPLAVIGIFFFATGANMMYSNGNKLYELQNISSQNIEEFVASEIKRVEGFQYLYPLSIAISAISFVVALSFLYFSKNSYLQAVAIALILFGMAFAVIDYFSKERSNIYFEQLKSYSPIK
jgi:hypothetical protein